MGYTTDANYLIQAGKDLSAETSGRTDMIGEFESGTDVPWHSWGSFYAEVSEPYDFVQASMDACMLHVQNLLGAYGEALRKAGEHYRAIELANEIGLGRIR